MLQWKELYNECMSCNKCELHKIKNNMVFGDGNIKADIVFVGEAPGADEDKTGTPFVGRAGQLLTKALEALNMYRNKDYYICNICKCRPNNNRTPYEEEAMECISYLRNQIALIKPKIIICLGATSMKYIMAPSIGNMRITRDRGKWYNIGSFKMMATFHPSAILRDDSKKRDFWNDLKSIKDRMDIDITMN